jgi:hypothetical protein
MRAGMISPLVSRSSLPSRPGIACGGTSAPFPATYIVGELKWLSETVVRDPRQGSCTACRIECCRTFVTLIAFTHLVSSEAQAHKSVTPTNAERFYFLEDGRACPWSHAEVKPLRRMYVMPWWRRTRWTRACDRALELRHGCSSFLRWWGCLSSWSPMILLPCHVFGPTSRFLHYMWWARRPLSVPCDLGTLGTKPNSHLGLVQDGVSGLAHHPHPD